MTAAKLIAPAIETSFAAGFDWFVLIFLKSNVCIMDLYFSFGCACSLSVGVWMWSRALSTLNWLMT